MKWEYKTAKMKLDMSDGSLDVDKATAFINTYGEQGWELLSGIDLNRNYGATSEIILIFKRPKDS